LAPRQPGLFAAAAAPPKKTTTGAVDDGFPRPGLRPPNPLGLNVG